VNTRFTHRAFPQRTLALGGGVIAYYYTDNRYRIVNAVAGPESYALRIIHSNNYPERTEPAAQHNPDVTCKCGSAARRKMLFDQFRSEAAANNQNILFLETGTLCQDAPYFNIIQKGSEQIGLFGLTLTRSTIACNDSIAVAQSQVTTLRAAGCSKIVALNHVGYGVDRQIAQQVDDIAIILGNHTHTPLLPAGSIVLPLGVTRHGPYATLVRRADNSIQTVIVSDWGWDKWIGDFTVGFDAAGLIASISGTVHPVWTVDQWDSKSVGQ
jgi:2',3'-cyclic-nucleotide 2'-phosphodiesterase (5'-nucleotidase family)